MLKNVMMAVGGLAGVALVGVVGVYVYAGSALNMRLHQRFDVAGKDIPVPFPLTDAELEELRAEKRKAREAAEGQEGGDAGGKGEKGRDKGGKGADKGGKGGKGDKGGGAAEAPAEKAPEADPLEGMDLDALAMERAIARGEYLAKKRLGCTECHGETGGGTLVADAMPVWKWYAPNITNGGRTSNYKPSDFDRIVRHGVKQDGTPATMPSVDYMSLSDREVSDVAAWVMSLAPIAEQQPEIQIGPLGRFLIGFGKIPISAELIDHRKVNPVEPPPRGPTVEYGGHVAATCAGCHRTDYSGGPIVQGPPDWPPARNLTPHADGLAGWTEADWMRVFQEGKRPDGTELSPVMPWKVLGTMGDVELKAMFMYLQSIEAKPTGT